jgi:hypothetical protein
MRTGPAARSYEEIKQSVIDGFIRSFPGETVTQTVFSEWVLCLYCEIVERHAVDYWLAQEEKRVARTGRKEM